MIAQMMTQIENPALQNSRFRFDEVLFLDTNFHRLNLTRGRCHLPPLDWISQKKAIINPQNSNEECFEWGVIVAENVGMKDPQRILNLRKFVANYDWSVLEFPVPIKNIIINYQIIIIININIIVLIFYYSSQKPLFLR